MNILFLSAVWPSASELWMHRMIESIESHTVAFATMLPREQKWRQRIPTIELLPWWAIPVGRFNVTAFAPGLGSRRLEAALDEHQVDLVFCQYATTGVHFENVWSRTKVPLWIHCHGYDVTWNMSQPFLPWRRHGQGYQRQLCRLADRANYIANSRFTKSRMMKIGIPEDRIAVKYFGVPCENHSVIRSNRGQNVEILFLGRLVDFKGPDLTIRAFERASELGLNGRLTIAGGGQMWKPTQELVQASRFKDRIRMLGSVDAATGERLRAEADIFTAHNCVGSHTGQEEAWGVSFVEAMAAGLPVVTGRSGGVQESVVDGVTGILVEPGDVEAHAQSLVKLAQDPALREKMGSAGAERARSRFSLEQERQRLAELFGIV